MSERQTERQTERPVSAGSEPAALARWRPLSELELLISGFCFGNGRRPSSAALERAKDDEERRRLERRGIVYLPFWK